MTKTKRRMQTGGWELPWPFSTNKSNVSTDVETAETATGPTLVQQATNQAESVREKIRETTGYGGGSRRRRSRCTKKHRHSSACKRKSKGRKRR